MKKPGKFVDEDLKDVSKELIYAQGEPFSNLQIRLAWIQLNVEAIG